MLALMLSACQNQGSSSAGENAEASSISDETVLGKIPASTTIDSNWVRIMQGTWTLEDNDRSTIEIDGNTYSDKMDDTANGVYRMEYSTTCNRCETTLDLKDNKCLALFNKEDESVRRCLLVRQLSTSSLELISINHPDVIYKYIRK